MALKIGWSIKMKSGQRATIINIINENDIDVQFEDGSIIKHITYHRLMMRGFKSPKEIASNPKKITYDKIKQRFEEKGYFLLTQEYSNAFQPLEYICTKHPESVQTTNWNRIQQGSGCKYCGYKKVSNVLQVKKRTPYNKVKQYFAQANLKLLTTEEEYMSQSNPVLKFVCSCHENLIQEKTWKAFLQSPYCSLCLKEQKVKAIRVERYQECVERCEQKGYVLISSADEYKNVLSPLKYICPKHGVQTTNLSHLREGKGCPICCESKGESKIRVWLESNQIKYVPQKRFNELYMKSSRAKLSYDFFLPSYNLLIEYQGEYHDGTVNKIAPYRQSVEEVFNQQERDKLKRKYAENNGYRLLEIWYSEFDNIESILEKELIIDA